MPWQIYNEKHSRKAVSILKNGEISIFDKLGNQNFFAPLNSKYARIYYDCAVTLVDISTTSPIIIYDEALDRIQQCINRFNSGADESTDIQRSEIFANMVGCGWITPKKLNAMNQYETTITKDCGRIFFALRDYASAGKTEMANHLYHMQEILYDILRQDKTKSNRYNSPYQSVYLELIREQQILTVDMVELYNNIDTIVRQIVSFSKSEELMEFLIGDTMIQKFFDNYWRMKHNGRAGFIKSSICNGLERVMLDEELMQKTAEAYAEDKNISVEIALHRIEEDYENICLYLGNTEGSSYAQIERQIDAKIQSYTSNLNTKFSYVFSRDGGLKQLMNKYFALIKKHGNVDDKCPDINDAILLGETKMICDMSFKNLEREKSNPEMKPMEIVEMSDEEKYSRTEALKDSMKNKYSQQVVAEYFNHILGDRDSLILDNSHLDQYESGYLFAAGITFSGAQGFPFKVTMLDYYLENDTIKMKNIKIERVSL